jgi:hypothetical protein
VTTLQAILKRKIAESERAGNQSEALMYFVEYAKETDSEWAKIKDSPFMKQATVEMDQITRDEGINSASREKVSSIWKKAIERAQSNYEK